MNRLYVVECTPSGTGAKADHRWPLRDGQIAAFARTVAAKLDETLGPVADTAAHTVPDECVDALVLDLQQCPSSSLVIPGDYQPPEVHALAHAMNQALGNAGTTVVYTDPVEARPVDQIASLRELVQDMERG